MGTYSSSYKTNKKKMRAVKVAALDRIAPASLGPLEFETNPLKFQ